MTWLVTFRWLSQGAEFHGISPGPPPPSSPAPASRPALRLAACWSRPPAQAVPAEAWPPRAFSWSHLGSRPSSSMKFMPRGVPESPHCLFLTWLPHFCTLLTPKPLSASKAPSLMLVSGPSITCLRSGYLPAPSGLGSASPRHHPPPKPGPYLFAVKLAFIAFTVHHSLLVLALARLDIPANPQGSCGIQQIHRGGVRGICSPYRFSAQGGEACFQGTGTPHPATAQGPASSALCRKGCS